MTAVEENLEIEAKFTGEFLVLNLKGKLDALSSPSSEKNVFKYINAGHHQLIFVFSDVNYLSSAGLRMLLSIAKRLKALSGMVVLCDVQDNVIEVLNMSGFDQVLELADNIDDAMKKFNVSVT